MVEDAFLAAMPEAVAERVRVRRRAEPRGEFVLYWMVQALRGHENPALDAALLLGERLGLPVVVYQGLSERHPYASDRLHTFMLEGGRDAAEEVARRGALFCCHVERPGSREPWLRDLGRRAAWIVAEENPVAPLPRWLAALAKATLAPVWTVDTACIVPMRLVRGKHDRAFAFRAAIGPLLEKRLHPPWTDVDAKTPAWAGAPPFEPMAWSRPIHEVVAEAEIDHTIGAVPETPGGSRPGYRRWEEFRRRGLRNYGRTRNDAANLHGVSRMSAYLHFGMVSPMRIAREAAAVGGPGAEKYLDELLTWRELAHHFCFRRRDHDSLAALPAWAMQTLAEYEIDERPMLPSLSTLARGRTGDELWDACQQSLLRHGELHNNVRMTWGKALLGWTPNAKAALAALIDLNHRYALDGRDPCSFGGLLWCLGQFDRPFTPEQPILGTVRPRSTRDHSRRIDMQSYRSVVDRPAFGSRWRIAVVGSGMAGLTAARTLADHGLQVEVFDKGRVPGGRAAVRRRPEGCQFSHGLLRINPRDRRFRRELESWIHDGLLAQWRPRAVSLHDFTPINEEGLAAPQGFDAWLAAFADRLNVKQGTEVVDVRRNGDAWQLTAADGAEFGAFDALLITTPPTQAAKLLGEAAPELARAAGSSVMQPCWTVMVAFSEPLGLPWDWGRGVGGVLAEVVRENSRPGMTATPECWTLQATPAWSAHELERTPEDASRLLFNEFARLTGRSLPTPLSLQGHRWRYARVETPIPERSLFDANLMAGLCGDWCGGADIEGAYLSGAALAGRLLGVLASRSGERFELNSEGSG